MLFMVERGITGGMCQAIHGYAKANSKYMKNYDKNKESSFTCKQFLWIGNVSKNACKKVIFWSRWWMS